MRSTSTHRIRFLQNIAVVKDQKSALEMAWRQSYEQILNENIHLSIFLAHNILETDVFEGAQIGSRWHRGPGGPVHSDSHNNDPWGPLRAALWKIFGIRRVQFYVFWGLFPGHFSHRFVNGNPDSWSSENKVFLRMVLQTPCFLRKKKGSLIRGSIISVFRMPWG